MTNALIRSMQYPMLGVDVFDDIFKQFFTEGYHPKEPGFPQVMQKQTDNEMTFQFALAGYTDKDLSVLAENGTITIKGQKADENENLFASRAFTWSRKDAYGVWDLEKSEVTFKNGLLTLKIPKKESAQPKMLPISVK